MFILIAWYKGGKVQQLNRHFRNMVAAAYPTYDSTTSKISKRKIGLKIYQAIIDRGGKFLDLDGNPMDRPKSILKVMKGKSGVKLVLFMYLYSRCPLVISALKDAKTWTSDAKRQAKRKREEARSLSDRDLKKPHVAEKQEVTPPVVQQAVAQVKVDNMQTENPISVDVKEAPVATVALEEAEKPDESKEDKGETQAAAEASNSTLLEKRGQALPTQKQKKKDPSSNGDPSLAGEENQAKAGGSIPAQTPSTQTDGQEETTRSEEPGSKDESSQQEQVALAAAAAAAAAAAVASDAQEGEKAVGEQKSPQAVLQGLQLLTKAAANAQDTREKPNTATV